MTCRRLLLRVTGCAAAWKHEHEAAHWPNVLVCDSMPCPQECFEAFSVASVHERLGKPPSFETSSTLGSGCVDIILHDALFRATAQLRGQVTAATKHRPSDIAIAVIAFRAPLLANCDLTNHVSLS